MNIELSSKIMYDTSIEASNKLLRNHWNRVYAFVSDHVSFDGSFSPKNKEYLKAIDLIAKGIAIIDIEQNNKTPKNTKKALIDNLEVKL